ncbi:Enteropeptidase, partial [Tieghemiomyces parasiticus]
MAHPMHSLAGRDLTSLSNSNTKRSEGLVSLETEIETVIGYTPQGLPGRLVNSPNQYPHVAFIKTASGFSCGASIISDRHLVTAASCVTSCRKGKWKALRSSDVKIALGIRYHSTSELQDVGAIEVYDKYDCDTHEDNIAVITLESRLEFGKTVAIIDLESGNDDENSSLTLLGLDKVKVGPPAKVYSGRLSSLSVSLGAFDDCAPEGVTLDSDNPQLVCANGAANRRPGPCETQEGNSLVYENDNVNTLVGFRAFFFNKKTVDCSTARFANTYVRVAHYRDFIDDATNIDLSGNGESYSDEESSNPDNVTSGGSGDLNLNEESSNAA